MRREIYGLLFSSKAKQLNEALFSDYRAVSLERWAAFGEEIRALCNKAGYTEEWTEIWVTHRYRLYYTLEWLKAAAASIQVPVEALEMGSESIVTELIRKYVPGLTVQNTKGDLRSTWALADQSVDLIISTEVLEHLSDLPDGVSDGFWKTGLKAALKEAYRVLRPGGRMLVTTPNAASIVHLQKALFGYTPWFYDLHVREYIPTELIGELQEAGFKIDRWSVIHCMTIDSRKDYTKIFQLLLENNYPTGDRGDDLFILACK